MSYSVPTHNGIAVAQYEIYLGGKPLPKSYYTMIEEVSYESHDTGSDLASINISDPTMTIINNPLIIKGGKVSIWGGWKGDMAKWLDGYIAVVDVIFPETGDPSITLHCMDESFIMDRVDVKYNYGEATFSQIARIIAQRHGLSASGPDTKRIISNASQADQTDIKYLISIGEEEDIVVKVKNGTLIWRYKDDIQEVQDTIYWRSPPFDIKSFEPRIALADKKAGIEEQDINTDTGDVEQGQASDSTDREIYGDIVPLESYRFDPMTGLWIPLSNMVPDVYRGSAPKP